MALWPIASVGQFTETDQVKYLCHMRSKLLVALLGLALFAPFLGSVRLFDWDEVNFAECAREMIETGDYMHVRVDYKPFHEKPPLFIWAQAASMNVFGINEFAARLPNALIGIISLVIMFSIGQRIHGERFGWLWTMAYAGSLLPHFYFRSGIIDPLFNLFIFLGFLWMLKSMQGAWARNAVIAGVFTACAVMTKGPVGYGLVMLSTAVAWFFLRTTYTIPWRQVILGSVVTVVLGSLWFLVDFVQNGPWFVEQNIAYQIRLLTTGDAGHEQPFWYHPVVVLIGCFPASLLLFGGLKMIAEETGEQRDMRVAMIVLLTVVLVVFSVVKTKIIHYSSLTYLPLTYLAAIYLERWLDGRAQWRWWNTATVWLFGAVWSALAFLVLWAFMDKDWLMSLPSFRDPFLRSAIQRDVTWFGFEPYIGLLIIVGVAVSTILRKREKQFASVATLFGSVALFVWLVLPFVAPRIEPYTQGAALDFYESKVGQDVYIQPLSFKTYAHLFYQRKPFGLSEESGVRSQEKSGLSWQEWLLNGQIDRPAFFVCKVNNAAQWRDHENLEELYEEGGFVFFTRRAE